MISVIVPVYNVEPYLRKCLNSILAQTYRDLEILVIDDGSTDGSGRICDEYGEKDNRIKVFHTENKGLSCARNLGLDNANGDWIGFVDSDDWIEPDMYELLLRKAEETGANIIACGCYTEFKSSTICHQASQKIVNNTEAVEDLINGKIRTQVWNKIFHSTVFKNIRFPNGRVYEDIATTYKLIMNTTVVGIPSLSYHYIQRGGSISQSHNKENLNDYWVAHRQRYEDLKDFVDENTEKRLLKLCAVAIARAWCWYLKCEKDPVYIEEMSSFAREKFPVFGYISWPIYLRIMTLLARFNNSVSLTIAYTINQAYRWFKPKYYE